MRMLGSRAIGGSNERPGLLLLGVAEFVVVAAVKEECGGRVCKGELYGGASSNPALVLLPLMFAELS
jgi:hypothetical protein